MVAHSRDQVSYTTPVESDPEKPLEHRMRSIELVCKRPLIELPRDFLAGHQALVGDQDLAIGVESSRSEHDVLGTIGKLLLSALIEQGEAQAHHAGEQRLMTSLIKDAACDPCGTELTTTIATIRLVFRDMAL